MAYLTHTHRSSFFWNSSLSDERKDEIIAWLQTLDDNQKQMIEELLQDARDEEYFNETYEG